MCSSSSRVLISGVRDARDFLCYNVGSKESPDWYGTIFGNGGAHISGEPGVVNIDVKYGYGIRLVVYIRVKRHARRR